MYDDVQEQTGESGYGFRLHFPRNLALLFAYPQLESSVAGQKRLKDTFLSAFVIKLVLNKE